MLFRDIIFDLSVKDMVQEQAEELLVEVRVAY